MYLFVLMVYIYVYPLIGNGPDWHPGQTDMPQEKEFCREMWWTNIVSHHATALSDLSGSALDSVTVVVVPELQRLR